MEEWAEYYTNIDNLAKISQYCKYREVVIIRNLVDRRVTVRPIKIFKSEHLKFWIERLDLRKTLFNIYISNASVKLPPLTSNLSQLTEIRKQLTEQWESLMTGYDIFVDIDIENFEDRPFAYDIAEKIFMELKGKYPHVQLWDTTRGYHIVDFGRFSPEFVKNLVMDICCYNNIPMSHPVKEKDGKKYYAEEGKWVQVEPNFVPPPIDKPNCDTSIYDLRRIRRIPYSLHSKTGRPMVKLA